jgi:hypothetical protein
MSIDEYSHFPTLLKINYKPVKTINNMPKSRLRSNRKVVALGSNLSQRKLSRTDIKIKTAAYNEKVEKYSELPLNDLMEMLNENTVGGVYRDALITVIKQKKSEQSLETVEA